MNQKAHLSFTLNGEPAEVAFAPHKTLLEVLREDLGLTGTKHGCELGECGTCTVLVDGKSILSCLMLGLDAEGREVTTVEGMAANGKLHPLQDTFADLGAAQCGYCSPGFLLAAKELIEKSPKPSRDEIKEALSGNLCRCTGQTKFADDIFLPRMLACKILRSHEPHARIKNIDVSKALALPGVFAVVTGKDFPIPYGILPVSQDEHALCVDKVRFVGDPVAAVIARDELTAFEALDLIDVEYEPLRTFAAPEDSLQHDDPRIHEYGDRGNIHKLVSLEFGDVGRALADADKVFEDTFFYQGNTHLPIEQHAAVAAKDPDGKLVLWSSTQTPHYVHRALARALDMPAAHIRVVATPNGGGFGGKSDPFNHEIVIAKAAWLLDRPVKICLTREEVFYCHRGRHPVLMRMKTGVNDDGTVTGVEVQTVLDGGAHGSYGVGSTFYTGALQTVTDHIPAYRFQGCRVGTRKLPRRTIRGRCTPPSSC